MFQNLRFARTGCFGLTCLALVILSACAHNGPGPVYLGGRKSETVSQTGIGVNGFLWRASLETLSFMPLSSADPFGGVIITDWFSNPQKPDERFKATVYILDSRLRGDGLSVSVFKQIRDGSGGWTNAPVSPQTEQDVENAILTKARQLKISTINNKG